MMVIRSVFEVLPSSSSLLSVTALWPVFPSPSLSSYIFLFIYKDNKKFTTLHFCILSLYFMMLNVFISVCRCSPRFWPSSLRSTWLTLSKVIIFLQFFLIFLAVSVFHTSAIAGASRVRQTKSGPKYTKSGYRCRTG